MILEEKKLYILITDQILLPDCLLFEILGNWCLVFICFLVSDVTNIEINLSSHFSTQPKFQEKIVNISRNEKNF